jgi:Tfp pilus assembly protein PilP
MTWKSYVLLSGVPLIASYLVSTRTNPVEEPAATRRMEAARPAAAIDIEEQASRLQARIRAQAAYHEPSRNPFRFSERTESSRPASGFAPAAAAIEPLQLAPVRQPPMISLVGVATDEVDGVAQRTAILSTPQGVLLVRAGDVVGVEYKVVTVEEGAVELINVADSSIRRISFTP